MAELICYTLGVAVLAASIWMMVRYEKAAKPVAIGILAVPIAPLLVYGLTSHDTGKALICLITAAMYGGIMYVIFGRR